MKTPFIALTLAMTAGPLAATLPAQNAGNDSQDANWFSLGPQFGLNINARFNHIGNVTPVSPGPATGGGINRTYDDGFVKVDSSGDAGGQTWNWGYQKSSPVVGDIVMHSSSAAVNGAENGNGDPQPGFDLAYGRRLGRVLGGQWGLQAAFDFTSVSIHGNQPLSGTGTTINDAYSLGGVIPPPAPYAGSYSGPGALLADNPTRTYTDESVVITGSHTLDAQVYALRLGPYFEYPFGWHLSGRVGGGLALGVADIQYSYNETINIGDIESVHAAGSSDGASFQAGGYLEAELLYALTRHTSLFAGAQFESLGTFSHDTGGEQAQLDMSSTANVLFGVQVSF